jgi:hypothetical protein
MVAAVRHAVLSGAAFPFPTCIRWQSAQAERHVLHGVPAGEDQGLLFQLRETCFGW